MNAPVNTFSEPRTDRRKFLLGLFFCTAAGVALWRQPRMKLDYLGKRKLEDLVPQTIGRWSYVAASGLVVPPQDQLQQITYSQMLTRVYSDGENSPIMLLMAQSGSQTGFLQIHRPETCYTAGGYHITPITPHPIELGSKTLRANRMDALSPYEPTEHIIYWTRVGDQIPSSWRQQKLAVAEQNLKGVIPDAILIRVSTRDDDASAALARVDDFIRAMFRAVSPAALPVLIV